MNTMMLSKLNANDESIRIIEWLIDDHAYVETGTDILKVETSKVVLDIASDFSGFILKHCHSNEVVLIGEKLASFYPEPVDICNHDLEIDKNLASKADAPQPLARIPLNLEVQKPVELAPVLTQRQYGTYFSAEAKKYITEHQIDADQFVNLGLITLKNVQEKIAADNDRKYNKGMHVEKLSSLKQTEIMLLSEAQSGLLSSSLTVEFDSVGIRKGLNKTQWLNGQILPYILHQFAILLTAHPKFTAFYTADHVHYYNQVNLGIAIDLGHGLKVVVIHDADKLSFFDLYMRFLDLISKYYENSLTLADVSGATITISDLSSDNVMYFQPILNKNQSVILGIGGDTEKEGAPLSLTFVFDHRILSGREVALFLNDFKCNLLKTPQVYLR